MSTVRTSLKRGNTRWDVQSAWWVRTKGSESSMDEITETLQTVEFETMQLGKFFNHESQKFLLGNTTMRNLIHGLFKEQEEQESVLVQNLRSWERT
jgi:hypothetical protein